MNLKEYLFGFAFLIFGLLPILPLVNHSYPMYLGFAGIGLIYIILKSIERKSNSYMVIILILWSLISFYNFRFTRATHWIRNEQAISKAYVDYVKIHIANPSSNSLFLFKNANINFAQSNNFVLVETEDTLKQSLNDQDAIQVIYNDATLKSIFMNNDTSSVLQDRNAEIYEVSPREN